MGISTYLLSIAHLLPDWHQPHNYKLHMCAKFGDDQIYSYFRKKGNAHNN